MKQKALISLQICIFVLMLGVFIISGKKILANKDNFSLYNFSALDKYFASDVGAWLRENLGNRSIF